MKNKLFIGIIFILICIINSSVYATHIELEPSSALTLKPAEEIHIKISVNDIDIEEGINVISGKLEYDKEIFEKVQSTNFNSKNNWSMIYNDEDTQAEGKFILMNLSAGIKEDQEMIEVTLKAKENIDMQNTTVKISELCTTKEEEIVELENREIDIKIKGKFNIKNAIKMWIKGITNLFHKK